METKSTLTFVRLVNDSNRERFLQACTRLATWNYCNSWPCEQNKINEKVAHRLSSLMHDVVVIGAIYRDV